MTTPGPRPRAPQRRPDPAGALAEALAPLAGRRIVGVVIADAGAVGLRLDDGSTVILLALLRYGADGPSPALGASWTAEDGGEALS